MEPLTWAALIALAFKITSVLKAATAGVWSDVRTQVVAWVAGVAVVLLAAQADIAAGLAVGETALADFDLASLIIIGLGVGSSGSVTYDFKKAIDNTDTAQEPHLLGRAT